MDEAQALPTPGNGTPLPSPRQAFLWPWATRLHVLPMPHFQFRPGDAFAYAPWHEVNGPRASLTRKTCIYKRNNYTAAWSRRQREILSKQCITYTYVMYTSYVKLTA